MTSAQALATETPIIIPREHTTYSRDQWRAAVAQSSTIQGYWDWQRHMQMSEKATAANDQKK